MVLAFQLQPLRRCRRLIFIWTNKHEQTTYPKEHFCAESGKPSRIGTGWSTLDKQCANEERECWLQMQLREKWLFLKIQHAPDIKEEAECPRFPLKFLLAVSGRDSGEIKFIVVDQSKSPLYFHIMLTLAQMHWRPTNFKTYYIHPFMIKELNVMECTRQHMESYWMPRWVPKGAHFRIR